MTTQDQNAIIAAIQPLDQFASQAPLQRVWHAQWQAIFQQVVTKVLSIGTGTEKPADNGKTPPGGDG